MKTKEQKSQICAIIASVLVIAGYGVYFLGNFVGTVRPNVSSWIVLAFLAVLNLASYRNLTKSWVKSTFSVVNTILIVLLALLVMRNGSFGNLGIAEWTCLVFGVAAGLCWWIFQKKNFTKVLVQVVLETGVAIAFIPTIISVAHNPSNESWLTWLLWTGSFFMQFLVVKLDWSGKYIDFLFPLNRVALNGLVCVLAFR